ncbi:hypothetical protein QLL95_gp1238 [Cotonvirus japonicus]|uniref:Uncharacterized protein n=1 Tax=Cotonvirus japonicus TaxID=2811091 RepID=A0ABM7NRU5_9VIRU|nr:hypothetical protein QLL95_gp1238 [Cotonvirus japonicus]BCS82885.1 hypothetical protein [Cotonvirus japonicus]
MSKLSPIYSSCAEQGSSCPLTTYRETIAYANPDTAGPIFYRNDEGTTANSNKFSCSNASFGNPTSSTTGYKCFSGVVPEDIRNADASFYDNGAPKGWTKCADENSTCNPNQNIPVDILFGTDSSYVYANAESVPCNTATFGDPKVGSSKACYWRDPTLTPVSPGTTPTTPTSKTPWWRHWGVYVGAALIILFIIIIVLIILFK